MKIYIIGEFAFPNGGGPAKRVKELAMGFLENGCDVEILSLAMSKQYQKADYYNNGVNSIQFENNYLSKENLGGLIENKSKWNKINWFFRSYVGAFLTTMKFLFAQKIKSDDIMLFYAPGLLKFIPFIAVAKWKGCKIIFDIVEDVVSFKGFGKKWNPVFWDWKAGYYVLPRISNVNAAITTGLQDKFQKINNTIIVPTVMGWEGETKHLRNGQDGMISLLYIGALVEKDDPVAMLNLIRRVNEKEIKLSLTLAGMYAENKSAQVLLDEIHNDPILQKSIHLVGAFANDQFQTLMDAADAIVLLRGNDSTQVFSFPTRLVEYLSLKKAVITTKLGDIPKYLKHGEEVILLEPGDVPDNAAILNNFINDKSSLREIGQQGFCKGRQHFNRKVETKKILSFLN